MLYRNHYTSICTTTINSWNATRLQKNANSLEREERKRAFQRKNLLKLQDELQNSIRFMGQANIEDEHAYIKSGEWGSALLSTKISNDLYNSNRQLLILTERIESDELRSKTKTLRNKICDSLLAKSQTKSKGNRSKCNDTIFLVNGKIR